MTQIIVAGGSDVGDIAYGWGEPIRSAWRGPTPALRVLGIRDALRLLLETRDDSGVCLLAIIGDPTQAGMFDALMDHVVQRGIPAMVLARDPKSLGAGLEEAGVLVEAWETPSDVLGIELSAIMRRQSAIRDLSREVRLATASAHGLAEELRHVHEELEIAASVQRDILPKRLPEIDGLDCGLLFRPAGQVSGDIYDLCELDDGRVAFFVADAVGHGVPAALLTMLVAHHMGRAQSRGQSRGDLRPARVLHELNRAMCERQFSTPRFATAVFGVVEPWSGRVTLSGAGHPLPLVLGEGGSRMIETNGPLLGIFEEAMFDEASFTLGEGETLLVYSDGFETAFPSGESASDGRNLPSRDYLAQMGEVIAGGSSVSAGLRELTSRVDRQRGSLHQADDLTALVIRRVAKRETMRVAA